MERANKYVQVMSWQEARPYFADSNPAFTNTVDAIDPGNECKLYRVSYPYGAPIVTNGELLLPDNHGRPCELTAFPNRGIAEALSYSPIPLSYIASKSCEIFVNANNQNVVPLKLLEKGEFFGMFETLNFLSGIQSRPPWCVTAGARSLCLLPKISNSMGHQRLVREFNTPTLPPRHHKDHWRIFKYLANHPSAKSNWRCEVIFFSKDWLNNHNNGISWLKFYQYLYKTTWRQAHHTPQESHMSLTWQAFANAIGSRNLKPRPYLTETVRHLLAASMGMVPSFVPATNDQAAPISILGDIYVNCYNLKHYLPTFIRPVNLTLGKSHNRAYYSLSVPIVLEGTPATRTPPQVMTDLRDVKRLIDTLKQAANSDALIFPASTPVLQSNYEYYHTGSDMHNEILPASEIPVRDTEFMYRADQYPDRSFCATSPFLNGCVAIRRPQEEG